MPSTAIAVSAIRIVLAAIAGTEVLRAGLAEQPVDHRPAASVGRAAR